MDHKAQQILSAVTQLLIDSPDLRFGQVIFNLGINEWANPLNPASEKYQLRDIYNDTNEEILKRIKQIK